MKNKITTIGIIIATIVLAGVAVFTAVRLYQLRQESITPVKPTSKPKAEEVCPTPKPCTSLVFKLGATPTPTPSIGCNSVCTTDADCDTTKDLITYICYKPPSPTASITSTTGFCRLAECPTEADCLCGRATPTPTPKAPTPTPSPTRPPGSTNTPTPIPGATYTPTPIPGATYTPTPIPGAATPTSPSYAAATATPVPGEVTPDQPALPNAGISFPTILGISLGTLLLIGALILAL